MRAERLHHLNIFGNLINAGFYAATGAGIHANIMPPYAEDLARFDTRIFVAASIAVAACYGTSLATRSQLEHNAAAQNGWRGNANP